MVEVLNESVWEDKRRYRREVNVEKMVFRKGSGKEKLW
jgi:hypothetical protein